MQTTTITLLGASYVNAIQEWTSNLTLMFDRYFRVGGHVRYAAKPAFPKIATSGASNICRFGNGQEGLCAQVLFVVVGGPKFDSVMRNLLGLHASGNFEALPYGSCSCIKPQMNDACALILHLNADVLTQNLESLEGYINSPKT
jgi:hypothetical protein